MKLLSAVWASYQRLMATHPWKTQSLTTGVMIATGDCLTQQLIEKKGLEHSIRRTLRMGTVGLMIGPITRTWFLTLERFIPPATKFYAFKKLVVDQTVFAPFIIFMFFNISGTLAGKKPHQIKQDLKERYFRTLFTAYKVWPLAQAVNFTFVPVQHRVNFVQIVSVCWHMYLSWMSNKL